MSWGVNHQVGINASPEEIYKALTETEKLAQWRTTDARGSSAKFRDTLELSDNMVNGLGIKGRAHRTLKLIDTRMNAWAKKACNFITPSGVMTSWIS